MRKLLCLFLVVGLLGAMTLTSGCFGDDGIGSILAAAIVITIPRVGEQLQRSLLHPSRNVRPSLLHPEQRSMCWVMVSKSVSLHIVAEPL